MRRVVPPLVVLAIVLGVWLLFSYALLDPDRRFLLPPPQRVVRVGFLDWSNLREIWLLDFKTDRVGPKELAEKAEEYAPQLRLYARALSQIYERPVTGCWLYFLARQAAVPVDIPVANAD